MKEEDLKEFDELVRLMDSRRQMNRIAGRTRWRKFAERFTKDELDAAWAKIKDQG